MAADFSLFPKREEWGTGDEAQDQKLAVALKSVMENLSFESICDFYAIASTLKPRAFNPSYNVLIEMVTKALFFCYDPKENNHALMTKMKGRFHLKTPSECNLLNSENIIKAIRKDKHYRYNNQLDFYLHLHEPMERNPFVKEKIFRGDHDLTCKMIYKDLKSYLSGEVSAEVHDSDPLLKALSEKNKTVSIDGLGVVWYDQGHIYCLSSL